MIFYQQLQDPRRHERHPEAKGGVAKDQDGHPDRGHVLRRQHGPGGQLRGQGLELQGRMHVE